MKNIKLSDLQLPDSNDSDSPKGKSPEVFQSGDTDLEMARVKTNYNQEMNERKNALKLKITHLEKKLKKHELKEGMLDMIIAQTYTELENLKDNEFSKRGQKQTVLIKQLEALSIMHDTILKYEDMIQKYHKILMDIENNKLNSYIKIEGLKKEEDKADDNISSVLNELQQLLKGGATSTSNSMLEEIQKELEDGDY